MKANIEKDPETGELMLVFPEDFLEQLKEMKWEIGDTVEWVDNEDGTWSIKKVDDNLIEVCCESHGGPVGLHCNHDHCTGPKWVKKEDE